MGTVSIFAGFIVLGGVIFYFSKKYEKKRKEDLTQFFLDLSFRNIEQGIIPDFKMTSKGRSRRRYNNFEGNAGGFDISVFDYRYTVGGGKNSHTYIQTVAMTNVNLPNFQLSKEGLFEKLADKFSNRDIDFFDYPDFSNKYVLKGDDEEAIRRIFNSKALLFFEDIERDLNKCCYVESNGRELMFCIPAKRIKLQDMNMFLEKSKECFGLFV